MRILNDLCCGRNRWIFSAVFTIALVLFVLALPVWDFHVSAEVSENFAENAVSLVTVRQKKKIKAVEKKTVNPVVPKNDNIPSIPKEKENEPPKEEESQEIEENEENLGQEEENPENGENADNLEGLENSQLSEEVQKATANYKSYALSRIASKKTYPYSARSKGIEGKVRVRLVIENDGSVSACEIVETCNSDILNEACLMAIKKASPFKKMPAGMKSLSLTFVMDYSLK